MKPAAGKISVYGIAAAVLICAGLAMSVKFRPNRPVDAQCALAPAAARISPDYAGVVLPPNIAPLNFVVEEPGERYCVRISSTRGEGIEVLSNTPVIRIPADKWHALLEANRGEAMKVDVYVKSPQGQWTRFQTIRNDIAREDIDRYLAYRFMRPVYSYWDKMSLCQRDLSGFEEHAVLNNEQFHEDCVNCHSFQNRSSQRMLFHVRSPQDGSGSVVVENNKAYRLDTMTGFKAVPVYCAWHPTQRALAFSSNKIVQFFHTLGENRDVFDKSSRIVLYDFDTNVISTSPEISSDAELNTYPTWSPDGKCLYFCSARKLPIEQYKDVHYDLMRIPYDIETNTWGKREVVLSASKDGRSVAHPRISPDGRYLLCCLCGYGNFSIFHADTDLYLIDLQSGQGRPLEINSNQADSWHEFSSNGRWIVFSSKRRDGVFTKPYFSYFDAEGHEHKPFVLPQEDPTYYDRLIKIYNVPEFVTEPITAREGDLVKAITSAEYSVVPDVATQPSSQPYR